MALLSFNELVEAAQLLENAAAERSRLISENEGLRAEAARMAAKAEDLQKKIDRAAKILSSSNGPDEVRQRRMAMKVARKDAMVASA